MFFDRNICQFVPKADAAQLLHPLHFVVELKSPLVENGSLSVYRVHFVLEGTAKFKTRCGEFLVQPNDVFFCLPGKNYSLEPNKDFKYAYVSYFGIRAAALADKYKVSEKNCVFKNLNDLKWLYSNALPIPEEELSVRAESVILYTFSAIGARVSSARVIDLQQNAASDARNFIDAHFSDPNLSLKSTCKQLSYSPKYLSTSFTKRYGLTFTKYLSNVRLDHAKGLFDRGITSIKTVAFSCGYTDPLYFSKVFKGAFNLSPRDYLKKIQQKNK